MKKVILIFYLLILFLVIVASYFFIINQNKKTFNNSNLDEEIITEEYDEEYIELIRDKNGVPISLQNLEDVESNIFIKKLSEVELNPKNILKVANEIYFVSEVVNENGDDGSAIFLYDVIARQFKKLYFYKKEAINTDITPVLVAIDIIANKLLVVLQDKDLKCGSLWLEQGNNFYTLDLLDDGKDGLVEYSVPEWKINEEKIKYPDCGM